MIRGLARIFVAVLAMSDIAGAQTPPATAPAQATPPPAGAGQRAGQPGGMNPTATLRTVQEMMDGYELTQAQTRLEMTDAQFQAFFPRMRDLQLLRRKHLNNRAQLLATLNQAIKPGANVDEATLSSDVKALDDLEAQMASDERAALAAVDAVLTPHQRARFRIFEENIEKQKLQMLAKVIAAPGRGPAPEPAPAARRYH